MTRSRGEIVADIEQLLIELANEETPDENQGWQLSDFMVIELWSRLNEVDEVDESVTVTHRQRAMAPWRAHGLLIAAAEEVDASREDGYSSD